MQPVRPNEQSARRSYNEPQRLRNGVSRYLPPGS